MGSCITKKNLIGSQKSSPQLPHSALKNSNKKLDIIGLNKGDVLTEYEINFKNILGEGAFGKVLKATHKKTNCERAIKIVSKNLIRLDDKNEKTEIAIMNEIEILRKLSHPNIMKIYEYFSDKFKFFIVTEYIQGKELFKYIQGIGHFTEKNAGLIFEQLLFTINYCHNQKVIHRDLKPENILVLENEEKEPIIKLIDFGTSILLERRKNLKDFVGSAYYVAPEVLKGKYDKSCDIWSCGVIFYILLVGFPPFTGENDEIIFEKISKGEFEIDSLKEFSSISDDAKDLLRNLLVVDPEKRMTAELALSHNFFKQLKQRKASSLENLNSTLIEINKFSNSCKLLKGTYNFIANFMNLSQQKEELKNIFSDLDKNKDGSLSKEEIKEGYLAVNNGLDLNEIFNNIDVNNDGKIDYGEFINATLKLGKELNKSALDSLFKIFDQDGNGKISIDELKYIFKGTELKDEEWIELVKEVDNSLDHSISSQQFFNMINKMF